MLIPANETIKDQLTHTPDLPQKDTMRKQMVTMGLPNCSGALLQIPFHLLTVAFAQQYSKLIQSRCFLTGPVDILESVLETVMTVFLFEQRKWTIPQHHI